MPSWISKVFGTGIREIAEGVDVILSRFKGKPLGEQEAAEIQLEFERLVQQRDTVMLTTLRAELEAKQKILVAELTQGDTYTKRARPSVVYLGLIFIAINYVISPLLQQLAGSPTIVMNDLPEEFWYAWAGICGTWFIGRSAERIGYKSRATSIITGSGSDDESTRKSGGLL